MNSSATMPVPETEPRRPITVVVAAGLMVAVAVTYLVASGLALVTLNKVIGATRDELEQYDVDTRGTITTIKATMVVTIVVYLAITITLLVLAVGNLRGRKGARVGTWVIAGLFLLCAVCGSVGNGGVTAGLVDYDAALTGELYPSWYIPTTIALDVLLIVLYAGIIVLLALPGSSRFFRFERLPPLVRS